MAKYRKKPVVIEAKQFTDESKDSVLHWVQEKQMNVYPSFDGNGNPTMLIPTLEGEMIASLEDYVICGVNGEFYPCKPDIFEKTYEEAESEQMNFGQAVNALKDGKKVARQGWNGKGMWIVLMPALYLPPFNTQDTMRKVNDRTAKHIGEDKPLDSQPYIAMWTAAGQWQPGWLASQADVLAEDWVVVD